MDNAPASSRPVADPDNAAVSARLSAIEERLDEIIRRLDELKNLVTMLDCEQSNRQRAEN
jgi:hypothetical protein